MALQSVQCMTMETGCFDARQDESNHWTATLYSRAAAPELRAQHIEERFEPRRATVQPNHDSMLSEHQDRNPTQTVNDKQTSLHYQTL